MYMANNLHKQLNNKRTKKLINLKIYSQFLANNQVHQIFQKYKLHHYKILAYKQMNKIKNHLDFKLYKRKILIKIK